MRTREEIEKLGQVGPINTAYNSRVVVELLLDIRDFLNTRPSYCKHCDKRECICKSPDPVVRTECNHQWEFLGSTANIEQCRFCRQIKNRTVRT